MGSSPSPQRRANLYDTKVKVLYSKKGLYVLMDATNQKLTAKFEKDFETFGWKMCSEVFLWPNQRNQLCFEYDLAAWPRIADHDATTTTRSWVGCHGTTRGTARFARRPPRSAARPKCSSRR